MILKCFFTSPNAKIVGFSVRTWPPYFGETFLLLYLNQGVLKKKLGLLSVEMTVTSKIWTEEAEAKLYFSELHRDFFFLLQDTQNRYLNAVGASVWLNHTRKPEATPKMVPQ